LLSGNYHKDLGPVTSFWRVCPRFGAKFKMAVNNAVNKKKLLLVFTVALQINPSQKVGGTDSKLGKSAGMLPEIFFSIFVH
jgi:hypothetical protein